jgi:hypothetical protein
VDVIVGENVGRGVRVIVGVRLMVGVSVIVDVGRNVRVMVGVNVGGGARKAGYAARTTSRVRIKTKRIPRLVSRKRIRAVFSLVSGIAQGFDLRQGFLG